MDNAIRIEGITWQRRSRARSGETPTFWLSAADHAAIMEQAETQRKENASPGGADDESDGSEDDSDDDAGVFANDGGAAARGADDSDFES
jgi:hypothetical protein